MLKMISFSSALLLLSLMMYAEKNVAGQPMVEIPEKYMLGLVEGKMHLAKQSIDLHYVSGGNPNADNLLVFVHGFPEFWYAWRHQLQHFLQLPNYLVYAFDLRGFGLSDRPAGVRNYTVDEHLEDLAEAIQLLKAKSTNPAQKVTLLSHDIGAAIGCQLNYVYPDLLDAFVMMNAPNPNTISGMLKNGTLNVGKLLRTPYFYKLLSFQFPYLGERIVQGNNFSFMDKLFLTDPNGAILNQGENTFSQHDLAIYKQAYSQPGAVTSALNFFRAPLRKAVHNVWEAFLAIFGQSSKPKDGKVLPDKIKAKCLVIWGDKDTVFGLEFGQAAANACEHGQLVAVNASHWMPEDVPAQVNSLVEQFVQQNDANGN